MNIQQILKQVEDDIQNSEERAYFWTHEERYRVILEQINTLTIEKNTIPGIVGGIAEDSGNQKRKLRILDVGCFPYHLGATMESMGLDVYGISSAHEPIQQSKIKVCNIETDTFPFKDNFFDIVVFTEVLEHLPQSPLFTLRQIYRVLKPGGYVILTTPNIARSINRTKLLLGKNVSYPLSQLLENDGKGSVIYHRHNREYTLQEVIDLMQHEYFTVEYANTFVSYTPNRRRAQPDPLWIHAGKYANYALMLMVAGMRDTILVVGKK